MIDLPPPFVPNLVVAGRDEALPPTEAVERAVILMTGRRWRKLAHRFVLKSHPYWEPLLDGYCPGSWAMLSNGDGSVEDRLARYRMADAMAAMGFATHHCLPLEPAFDNFWGYCRSCAYYYRHHKGSVYRVSASDLAREVTE